MSIKSHVRSIGLRFSHAVLGIAVIHQLIGSEWMAKPWKMAEASALQATLFEMHEWSGLAATVGLLVLLVCLARRYRGQVLAHFFPWTRAGQRAALVSDMAFAISALRRRTAPTAKQTMFLAGAIQGLGLLTLLFFALTGTAMWLLEDDVELMHRIGSIHELGALPLKLYMLGHAGMAILHGWRGEGLMRGMFLSKGSAR